MSYIVLISAPSTTEIYTLSLHDALPISINQPAKRIDYLWIGKMKELLLPNMGSRFLEDSQLGLVPARSEEHTSELQSRFDLVCRLLLEKKNEHKISH